MALSLLREIPAYVVEDGKLLSLRVQTRANFVGTDCDVILCTLAGPKHQALIDKLHAIDEFVSAHYDQPDYYPAIKLYKKHVYSIKIKVPENVRTDVQKGDMLKLTFYACGWVFEERAGVTLKASSIFKVTL